MNYELIKDDEINMYPTSLEQMFSEVLRQTSWFIKNISYTKGGKVSKNQPTVWHITIDVPNDYGYNSYCNAWMSLNTHRDILPRFKAHKSNNYAKACENCLVYYLRKQLQIFKNE